MESKHHHDPSAREQILAETRFAGIAGVAMVAAVAGLLLTLVLGWFAHDGFRRFYFAYLASFIYFLTIALGGLFFVLTQHVSRAGWSVSVRRVAEVLSATLPVMGVLSVPIVASVLIGRGDLYRWALPLSRATPEAFKAVREGNADEAESRITAPSPALVAVLDKAGDPSLAIEPATGDGEREIDALMLAKRSWLNPSFFIIRLIFYFVCWSWMAVWYWRRSVLQDRTGDYRITQSLQRASGLLLVLLGLTITLAAFDWIMSLDPHWFSTIFGIYVFAGSAVAFFAAMILLLQFLRRGGLLTASVNTEHFHDLGKYLFAFVFFWGYIAFSQYMLLWYANLPETVLWFARRGATTARESINGWSYVCLLLLFCNLLIPFGGLLSRHVKRAGLALIFWAAWLLVFHYLDVYWLIMPEYGKGFHASLMDLTAFIGVGGVFVATIIRIASPNPLRPTQDPRLSEALAFHNS